MGEILKKRAKKHGFWPEHGTDREIPRGIDYRKRRATARREARKRVRGPRRKKGEAKA